MTNAPLVEIEGMTKEAGGPHPIRIDAFSIRAGERAAITGLDAPPAEILVNLLTGATLPDHGEVRLFGRPTSAITEAGDWLATLDRIGMVTSRALLLDELSVAQAVAMSFTLSIDSIPDGIRKDVEQLCEEAGISGEWPAARLSGAPPLVRARIHLARALASRPELLLVEHPSSLFAGEAPDAAAAFASDVVRIAGARGLAVLALTARDDFARLVATRIFELDAATGRLRNRSGWRRFLG